MNFKWKIRLSFLQMLKKEYIEHYSVRDFTKSYKTWVLSKSIMTMTYPIVFVNSIGGLLDCDSYKLRHNIIFINVRFIILSLITPSKFGSLSHTKPFILYFQFTLLYFILLGHFFFLFLQVSFNFFVRRPTSIQLNGLTESLISCQSPWKSCST